MDTSELRAAAGRMMIAGFEGDFLPRHVEDALRSNTLGGVILFARNVVTPEQVQALNASVHKASESRIPFVSVDQEGGRVQRIREPATRLPPMLTVGQANNTDLAAKLGEAMGDELDALGFNLNFSPSVDVFTNPENTVIGDRAFGRDVQTVIRYAGAVMAGLTMSGIIPCIKHFPGHGDTRQDSHVELPLVEHGMARLRHIEMEPFRKLIEAGAPMVMTSHLLVPAIDPNHPVTFSRHGISELLRNQLNFGGVVISDDLEMAAIADRYSMEETVHLGLEAGLDIFLICHTREKWEEAWEHLVRFGERGGSQLERLAESARRIAKLDRAWLRPWQRPDNLADRIGTSEHRALVDEILTRAARRA